MTPRSWTSSWSTRADSSSIVSQPVTWERTNTFIEMIQNFESGDRQGSIFSYNGRFNAPRLLNNEFERFLLPEFESIGASDECISVFRNLEKYQAVYEWTKPRLRLLRHHSRIVAAQLDSLTISEDVYGALYMVFEDIFHPSLSLILDSPDTEQSTFVDSDNHLSVCLPTWLKLVSGNDRRTFFGWPSRKQPVNEIISNVLQSVSIQDLLDAFSDDNISDRNDVENLFTQHSLTDIISFLDSTSYWLGSNHPRALLYVIKFLRDEPSGATTTFQEADRLLASQRIIPGLSEYWLGQNCLMNTLWYFETYWRATVGRFISQLFTANKNVIQKKEKLLQCLFSRIDDWDIIPDSSNDGFCTGKLHDFFRSIDDTLIILIYTRITDAVFSEEIDFPTTNTEIAVCGLFLMRRAATSATAQMRLAELDHHI